MPDLLPCPFCGSRSAEIAFAGAKRFACCRYCSAGMPPRETEAEAVQMWNTRTDLARAQALAALEKARLGFLNLIDYGGLDQARHGETLAIAGELDQAIAAMKGGGK